MGALVDYWYYTGDTKWNEVATDGLLFQVGPNNDYMPPNQTRTEGNDDQGFWGMAVMTAAEYRFRDPAPDKPQWLALAQAVFNTQAARWDPNECGGGLRWQIFTWNNGYDYKNSISQGCFFNIAARLALYTGNQSYAEWADRTWDWMASTKLLDPESYYVYDGMHTTDCSRLTPYQWTYNAGAFLLGAAAMYNNSEGHVREIWRERVDGLLNGTMVFFAGPDDKIISEVACEPVKLCDLDQQSFKAYLARWMAATIKWAPWTGDRIRPLLESSAKAALASCVGGDNERMCGHNWTTGKWDGLTGVGQQMAAMEVLLANMIDSVPAPVTEKKGGTSAGDPGAGGSDVGRTDPFSEVWDKNPVSVAGRAGAGILTLLTLLFIVAGCVFMMVDETKSTAQKLEAVRTVAGRARGPALCWGRSKDADRSSGSGSPDEKMTPPSSSSSGGTLTPEKDIVVKTHENAGVEEKETEVASGAPSSSSRTGSSGRRETSSLSESASSSSSAENNGRSLTGRQRDGVGLHELAEGNERRMVNQERQEHSVGESSTRSGGRSTLPEKQRRTVSEIHSRAVRGRETSQHV